MALSLADPVVVSATDAVPGQGMHPVREQNLQERNQNRVLRGEEARAFTFCPRLSRGATLCAEEKSS
jgi:hypothetical protein